LFEVAGRKLLVATFPFDRDATDWPLQPTFVPFLDLCLQRLRSEDAMPATLQPREVTVFHLPTESAASEFVLSDGDKVVERGAVENRRVQLTAPARPGIYQLQFKSDSDRAMWLAVNPPPLESELKYVDPARIAAGIVQPGTTGKPADRPNNGALTRADILQQKLWWVILIVCLMAVFGENFWLAIRGRTL
jgi:hypothetical protein